MSEENTEASHAREGALAALREVAANSDRSKFGTAMDSFEAADYEEIVRLAWRYQFDDDRSKFKRELRSLQEHVSGRILARLELKAHGSSI